MKQAFFIIMLMLILAGCNWNPNNEYHAQREDVDGTNLITGGTRNHGFYQINRRDEDYNTNQNPNFIDLTENRPTIGDDKDKIVEIVDDLTEYEPGSVFINGSDAMVTVHTNKSLSGKERKKAEKELHRTLSKAMGARYHIHVNID